MKSRNAEGSCCFLRVYLHLFVLPPPRSVRIPSLLDLHTYSLSTQLAYTRTAYHHGPHRPLGKMASLQGPRNGDIEAGEDDIFTEGSNETAGNSTAAAAAGSTQGYASFVVIGLANS